MVNQNFLCASVFLPTGRQVCGKDNIGAIHLNLHRHSLLIKLNHLNRAAPHALRTVGTSFVNYKYLRFLKLYGVLGTNADAASAEVALIRQNFNHQLPGFCLPVIHRLKFSENNLKTIVRRRSVPEQQSPFLSPDLC